MSEEDKPAKEKPISPPDLVPWAKFLEDYPINSLQNVSGYYEKRDPQYGDPYRRQTPTLRLHCAKCKGVRNFNGKWTHHDTFSKGGIVNDFLKYTCRDCGEASKTFCVISQPTDENGNGCAVKIGEFPELHLELPASMEKFLGDDYSLFVKGLTCEKRGLGIGAFTYYRRVVESQKDHLITEVLRVAEKLGASTEVTERLKKAQRERQFSRAVEAIKGAIPESLHVDSHNPFKLLHDALSICVHAESDEQCLRMAHSIRLVLADLCERIRLALGEQEELRTAVSGLLKFTSEARKKTNESQPPPAN